MSPDRTLHVRPFRTLGNNAAGRAYARAHGLEYPFPNDYLDAPSGSAYRIHLAAGTVCSGISLVDPVGQPADHVVRCARLEEVAGRQQVPVAVWRTGGQVVQVSELYRP